MTRNCKTILAVLWFAAAVSAAPALAQAQGQATTPACVNNYPQRSLIETNFLYRPGAAGQWLRAGGIQRRPVCRSGSRSEHPPPAPARFG
jgi:hypothetical protein